jgi:hypothetical protein
MESVLTKKVIGIALVLSDFGRASRVNVEVGISKEMSSTIREDQLTGEPVFRFKLNLDAKGWRDFFD